MESFSVQEGSRYDYNQTKFIRFLVAECLSNRKRCIVDVQLTGYCDWADT